jgi:hypothetical protein
MSKKPGSALRIATAPVRLFGRSRGVRWALGGACVVVAFFAATLWALDWFFPGGNPEGRAVLAKLPPLPPLQPVSRTSYVIAPVAISLAGIAHTLENSVPRDLGGKNFNPLSNLASKVDIGTSVTRGPIAVSGKPGELSVYSPINGTMKIGGQGGSQASNLVGAIASLLDKAAGKNNATGNKDATTPAAAAQNGEVHGQVMIRAHPTLTADWRLQPNLAAQLTFGEGALSLPGVKINITDEIRPPIDRTVNEQVAALETRLRSDPFIEKAAREQWAKMCRAIPLGGVKSGLPSLWLEMRPVRAAAAQPVIDNRNLTLTIGVQAETRIVPNETKPDCPFPAQLELVPPMENGRVVVGIPIDVPFTELSKLLEAQLTGRRFPDDGSGPVELEVRGASLGAAGDRLLMVLRVKARETKSWFSLGGEATVQIWGKPVLDNDAQVLRLTDLSMAMESEAAFGLLGAAARAALPNLQQALTDNSVLNLKPYADDAKAKIGLALADFQMNSSGVRVEAAVQTVRLTGIEFDSNTLRVITEASGTAKVTVNDLPKMSN